MRTVHSIAALAIVSQILVTGCGITNECTNGAGVGGEGGEGTGTDHLGPIPEPGEGPPVPAGYGINGFPCTGDNRLSERATADEMADNGPELASIPILAPFDGWVTSVSMVHAVDDVAHICGDSPRRVFVSNPTKDSVPASPGIHEVLEWSTDDIEGAPYYLPQSDPDSNPPPSEKYYVVLTRALAAPFHVWADEYIHIGSLLDDPTICQISCEDSPADPIPMGDAYCGKGLSWSGCGVHPYPGSTPLAYIGWADFVEDAQ